MNIMKRNRQRKHRSGALIADIGAGTIAIGIIVAIVATAAAITLVNTRSTAVASDINTVIEQVRNQFAASSDYTGVGLGGLNLPAAFSADGASHNSGFTLSVADAAGRTFDLTLTGMEPNDCNTIASKLVGQLGSTITSITIKGTAATNPGAVATGCNTLVAADTVVIRAK